MVSVSVFQSAIVRVGRFESRSPLGRATLPTTGASVTVTRIYNVDVAGRESAINGAMVVNLPSS